MLVRWSELRTILWLRRVGTVSSCPRVTVEKGVMYVVTWLKRVERIKRKKKFGENPNNQGGHKKRAHPLKSLIDIWRGVFLVGCKFYFRFSSFFFLLMANHNYMHRDNLML